MAISTGHGVHCQFLATCSLWRALGGRTRWAGEERVSACVLLLTINLNSDSPELRPAGPCGTTWAHRDLPEVHIVEEACSLDEEEEQEDARPQACGSPWAPARVLGAFGCYFLEGERGILTRLATQEGGALESVLCLASCVSPGLSYGGRCLEKSGVQSCLPT